MKNEQELENCLESFERRVVIEQNLETRRMWQMLLMFTEFVLDRRRHPNFPNRIKHRDEALQFVRDLLGAPIPRIALENPVGLISSMIRKPDQYVQPWMFGEGESKKTGFWLKNLPPLKPTNVVEGRVKRVWREPPGPDQWKNRSRTYIGIAQAMASQWGNQSLATRTNPQ